MARGAETLRSRWDTVNGLPMHARVSVNEAPRDKLPVVLVHGLIVSSRYMVPTASLLAQDYTVYAPDLPGFGKSRGPDHTLDLTELADSLAAWMRAVRAGPAVLLGNSFGCQVIAEFALRHPGQIERAVLLGPTVDPRHRSLPDQTARWLLDWTHEKPSMALIVLRDYMAAGIRRGVRTLQVSIQDRIEEKLPRIRVPVLVVRGSLDPMVPDRWAREAAALLPRGRLAVIPGAPHAANYSSPVEVARLTRDFIEEHRLDDYGRAA